MIQQAQVLLQTGRSSMERWQIGEGNNNNEKIEMIYTVRVNTVPVPLCDYHLNMSMQG